METAVAAWPPDVGIEDRLVKPIQILDVIDHRNKYGTQRMIVVDRMPVFTYERRGSDLLIGHDSGFFNFYRHERPGPTWAAFSGRKFTIPMSDGSVIEADGQWWDVCPRDFSELTYDLGVNTIADLARCYVFMGGYHVDRVLIDSWVAVNEPSNNYHKYDPGHPDFGKHTIVSPWGTDT